MQCHLEGCKFISRHTSLCSLNLGRELTVPICASSPEENNYHWPSTFSFICAMYSRRSELKLNWYWSDWTKTSFVLPVLFVIGVNSCQDIKMKGHSKGDGMYWLDPDGESHSNAFLAYCDMTSYNGGWTMCYTTDEYAKPRTEVKYNFTFPYGTDGYRTNCNNVKVSWLIALKGLLSYRWKNWQRFWKQFWQLL